MDRQLLDAARFGDLTLVEQALQNGAKMEATDICGNTPFHLACSHGYLDIVQELVARGANLESTGNGGQTPLHLACTWGHLAVVQKLVARGANREATVLGGITGGMTPLHLACMWGHLAVVEELVARGADLFVTAANGKTAFDLARGFYRSNVVDYLLRAYVTVSEDSLAIHAILQSATFLAANSPLDPLQVQLPLGKLTFDHYQTLLQLFPANSFRRQDNDGALPLHIACRVGAPIEILGLLVQKYPAALQTKDNNGELPLHAVCRAGAPSLKSIRYVVEQDPNAVQAANNDGALPLHLLCGSRPSVQAVQYLVGLFQGALAMRTNAG